MFIENFVAGSIEILGIITFITLFCFTIIYVWEKIINKLTGWNNKDFRKALFYWLQNKEKIVKLLEQNEKLKK